jgi:hypothetical protein
VGARRREAAERRRVVEQVRARDRVCQAADVWPEVACAGPLDCHEVIPRSVWPKGYLDPANVRLVCRVHHDLIGDQPKRAAAAGLHGFSWEIES